MIIAINCHNPEALHRSQCPERVLEYLAGFGVLRQGAWLQSGNLFLAGVSQKLNEERAKLQKSLARVNLRAINYSDPP
jgi:hypothetical protein